MSVTDNYNKILKEVTDTANRYGSGVSLLCVSKNQALSKMEELVFHGVDKFGESKVQEALPKIDYLKPLANSLEFHYIGMLQTNKIKKITEYFNLIHSADKIEVVEAIDKCGKISGKKQDILIQLNLAAEPQKNGVPKPLLDELFEKTLKCDNILLRGFMFMPPYEEDTKKNIKYFKEARRLFEKYRYSDSFNILSMGMSHDFKEAIAEGSTLVRIGSSIFGERG